MLLGIIKLFRSGKADCVPVVDFELLCDVNILAGSIHTLKENSEALVAAAREIGLEVSADKTKYMVMSRDQNAGRTNS